jgi:hypothetical protein
MKDHPVSIELVAVIYSASADDFKMSCGRNDAASTIPP